MKKIISVLLTVFMLVNLLVVAAVPAAADTAVDLPANTAIVNLNAKESDTTVVWQGTTYNVTYGTNYFNSFNGARDSANMTSGMTIMLMPGEYPAIALNANKGSMTILGPKAGVNPNVKGNNSTDTWTLNPERSKTSADTEAIMTNTIYTTTGSDGIIANVNLTIDGVVFSNNGGYIRSLNYAESVQNITVKNSIVQDKSVPFIYTYQATPSNTTVSQNLAERNIVLENIHVTGRTTKSLLGALAANSLTIDGLYMDATCTQNVLDGLYIPSTVSTDPLNYEIKNSFIATRMSGGTTVVDFSFVNNSVTALAAVNAATTRKIYTTVDNTIFKHMTNTEAVIRARFASGTETLTITNNIFDQSTNAGVSKSIMNAGSSAVAGTYIVDNNSFIKVNYASNINASYQSTMNYMTRSYNVDKTTGNVTAPTCYGMLQNGSYYTDAAKTNLHYTAAGAPEFKLLGVQASALDKANNTVDLRFVFPVSNANALKNAGLYIMVDEDTTAGNVIKTGKVAVTEVYKSINANYGATKVTSEVGYLMAVIVEDVPADKANMVMSVQPYYTKEDGTAVATQMYDLAVTAEGKIVDKTASYTASNNWLIDVPAADATYVNTTVVDGYVVFNYTATEQQVAAYKTALVTAGFTGSENTYTKGNTVVTLAVNNGALTVTVKPSV